MNLLAPLAVLLWGVLTFVGLLVLGTSAGSSLGLFLATATAGTAYISQIAIWQFEADRLFGALQVTAILLAIASAVASLAGA